VEKNLKHNKWTNLNRPPANKNVGLVYGTKQLDKVNSKADLDNILMTLQSQLSLDFDGNIMKRNKHKADFLKITNKRIGSLKSKKQEDLGARVSP